MSRERSSREIRESIEATRARMDATIDELERRLSPREIVDHAWGYVREHGHGVGDALRDHPVPLSLMGLGVAWLAVEEARGNGGDARHGVGTYERAEGRVGPYRGDAIAHDDDDDGRSIADRARDAASGVKHAASGVKHAASGAMHKVEGAIEGARERASHAGDRARSAREGASHAASDMRRRTGDMADSLRTFYRDSPLAVGAITFGLGLAAALSGPSTHAEDELMGEASDAVKRRAKRTAEELTGKAANVAADAAIAAKAEARNQSHGLVDEVKERAQRVADEAKDAARKSTDEKREEGSVRTGLDAGRSTTPGPGTKPPGQGNLPTS